MIGRCSASKLMAAAWIRREILRRSSSAVKSGTSVAKPSADKPFKGHLPSTGAYQGHIMDPLTNTFDAPVPSATREFFYRDADETDKYRPWEDIYLAHFVSAVMWFWCFYYFYYHPWKIFGGDYYLPYLSEFSDAELGIPPDDGPDPEYWGSHQPEGYKGGKAE